MATSASYFANDKLWFEVSNILRLQTQDGLECVSGVDSGDQEQFSDRHLTELQPAVEALMSLDKLDPGAVGKWLDEKFPKLSKAARASIDIALWDLAAKKAGVSLHQLLGATRSTMPAYASFPFYETLPEYIGAVNDAATLGFDTFKFHVWGSLEMELELVEQIKQSFSGTSYRFMIDLEGAYSFDEALRLGEQMAQDMFVWLEAPIPDDRLDEYAELRKVLDVLVLPAGYDDCSAAFISRGIERESWDAGRFDVANVGGISRAIDLLQIANDSGLPIELQSWGHSLLQAANLHLMLANSRTQYFEAPMPKAGYELGMVDGNLIRQGQAVAPETPGLGLTVDWDALPSAEYYVHSGLDL